MLLSSLCAGFFPRPLARCGVVSIDHAMWQRGVFQTFIALCTPPSWYENQSTLALALGHSPKICSVNKELGHLGGERCRVYPTHRVKASIGFSKCAHLRVIRTSFLRLGPIEIDIAHSGLEFRKL